MNIDEVKTIANEILRPRLGPFGFDGLEVETHKDHDGDDALFITARYRSGNEPPGGDVLLEVLGSLHERLRESGELRFPYLEHRFADEDATFDDEDSLPKPS
jgi:hypothetical protein